MAKFGLKGFWVGEYAENESTGALTYTNGIKVSKAVDLQENVTHQDAKLYADNGLDDEIKAIDTMEITVTPNGIDFENLATLIGLQQKTITVNGETVTGGYATTAYDEGAEVGFGFVTENRTSGTSKFVAIFYPRVKFSPPESENYTTRGESAEFVTSSYTGTCFATAYDGIYKYLKDFTGSTALADAQSYIEGILGVSST